MSTHYASNHYSSNHYLSAHYGRERGPEPFTPEGISPPASEDAEARYRRIAQEDEILLQVIMVWLSMKDR